jgi:cytochrome P450
LIEQSLTQPDGRLDYMDFAGSDLHELLAGLRLQTPVAWIESAQGWLVTGHDLAVRVMCDPELFTVADPRFSTAHVVGPSMVSLDGLEHLRQREPFGEQMRRRDVKDSVSAVTAATANALIASMRTRGSADLRTEFAGPVAAAVVVSLLGLTDLAPMALLEWCTAIDQAVEDFTVGAPARARSTVALKALRASIARAIDQPQNQSILQAVTGGLELDREEVLANAVFLALASVNPEGAILNAVFHLLQNPRQLELVRDEPDLLRGAVAESQRLEPATAFVDRYATADVTLGGRKVRRGDLVRVSLSGANRDESVFADPDRFDSGRANLRRQLTFATGPHACIGMHLTRLEAETALERLLGGLPGLRPDPRYRDRPEGLIFRKPAALHVLWDVSA